MRRSRRRAESSRSAFTDAGLRAIATAALLAGGGATAFAADSTAVASSVTAAGGDIVRTTPAAPGNFIGSVELGFDTFQEKYSIVDEDTVDSITELRARINVGYQQGSFLRDYLLIEARSYIGDDNYETTGRVRLNRRFAGGASRVGISANVARRVFRSSSSYEFANDYTRIYAHGYIKHDIGEAFAVRVKSRMESQQFDRRTTFDYDYLRNSVSLGGEWNHEYTSFVQSEIRFTTMFVPDSTEIQHESWAPMIDVRINPAPYRSLALNVTAERRHFAHEPTRSDYWLVLGDGALEWPVAEVISVELRDQIEHYRYDRDSDVYFDYVENRSTMLFHYNPSWFLRFGAGPTHAVLASGSSPQDEYTEIGARLGVEYINASRAWVSFAYEPGRRSYSVSNADALYSDYVFHRVSLFANVTLWKTLTASTFLDYQPEDHEREGDDATATLFSISLAYGF